MEQVVIIGGGPAGSALACYLAQAGIASLILEGANHPRPHVGESLVPSTTRQFRDLGFLPTMEREGFIRKYGASWHPPTRGGHLAVLFSEFPQRGVEQDYTYHVDRGRFDLLLLKHAESLGARVCQGVRVQEVRFEDGWVKGVRAQVAGRTLDVPCRFVADASGRGTLLGRQLGWKRPDAHFNQFAVHAWFEGVERGPRPDDIHVYFLPVERGWVWQIPITEQVTSVGVVADKLVFQESKHDYAGWFGRLSQSAPDVAAAMAAARRVDDFKIEADYSYCMDHFVGNGCALIGDAARFVDPIFSSGVSVALASAKFAAERIAQGFAEDDLGAEMLAPYEERLRRGTSIWYEFICLYYKLLPLFTRFIQSEQYRHQVLQLLQGEVYDRQEVPVLDAMRSFIAGVERTEGHLLAPALDQGIRLDAAPAAARSPEGA
jgi:flavin-dependent dehydrogenase